MKPTISEIRDESLESFLSDRIKEYNNLRSQYHREIRKPGSIQPFYASYRGPDCELEAGLSAESYWGWMDIDKLWVREDMRGRGFGSRLLHAAERAAIERGCRKVFLSTFEFQAPDFYLKRGFTILGIRSDYPPGSAYYWLEKMLPG